MGRKIPAKKHRGVKDPLVQHARRMQSIKHKINAPPKDPDEQPIPRSVSRLFAFQNKDKVTKKQKKKVKVPSKETIQKGVGDNPISRLKKLPGESGRGFSLRINSAIRALHDPINKDEYPQDLDEEDAKGERMLDQRERRKRKRKGKGKESDKEPKLSRSQKLALKKKAKQEKAAAEEEIKEVVYEHVGFGDITHAPPNLTVRPKMRGQDSTNIGAPRPGRKDLLLTSMLTGNSKKDSLVNAADLARRERARLDVVAAYRELKKQKRLELKTKKK